MWPHAEGRNQVALDAQDAAEATGTGPGNDKEWIEVL